MKKPAPPSEPVKQRGNVLSWVVCVTALIVALVAFAGHAILRPVMIGIFEDFDTSLPALTIWVLRIPSALSLCLGLLAAIALVFKEIRLKDIALKIYVNLTTVFVSLLFGSIVVVAYFLPMIRIMHSIQ